MSNRLPRLIRQYQCMAQQIQVRRFELSRQVQ
jgi:hypothetical protein